MSITDANIPFGICQETGLLRHISDVQRGKACGCRCPNCSVPLVAKQGKKQIHHFTHAAGAGCTGALETALHMFAKDVFLEHKRISLPSHRDDEVISLFTLESVVAELTEGDIRPDIVATIESRKFYIEVFVTHRVSDEKLNRLRKAKVSCLEIDLSGYRDLVDKDVLTQTIISEAPRQWVYNHRREMELAAEAEKERLSRLKARLKERDRQRRAKQVADQERAEQERQRQQRLAVRRDRLSQLVAHQTRPFLVPTTRMQLAHERVTEADLTDFLRPHEWDCVFNYDSRYWQSQLLDVFFLSRSADWNPYIPDDVIINWTNKRRVIHKQFVSVGSRKSAEYREIGAINFVGPYERIKSFAFDVLFPLVRQSHKEIRREQRRKLQEAYRIF